MKKIAVLGCTGSIGTQTLDVIRKNPDKLKAVSLVAFSSVKKLQQLADEFHPNYTALISVDGEDCLIKAVQNCDLVVVATKGTTAIECILYCLDNGIDVALANKEALVCAGALIMPKVGKSRLFAIDSEHCAISQCLVGHSKQCVDKVLLTASGGPFFDFSSDQLPNVDAAQALKHPNWSMGTKITIDSATMFNKSLELIEACWLFGLQRDDVHIVVHKQSVVHSMVQYKDGGVIAQLARPDMRLPIQLSLLGESDCSIIEKLDFSQMINLSFQPCDFEKFPCAKLGREIFDYPPLCATAMNSANDVCVDAFLDGKIKFVDFYSIIKNVIERFADNLKNVPLTVANIRQVEADVKIYTKKLIYGEIC